MHIKWTACKHPNSFCSASGRLLKLDSFGNPLPKHFPFLVGWQSPVSLDERLLQTLACKTVAVASKLVDFPMRETWLCIFCKKNMSWLWLVYEWFMLSVWTILPAQVSLPSLVEAIGLLHNWIRSPYSIPISGFIDISKFCTPHSVAWFLSCAKHAQQCTQHGVLRGHAAKIEFFLFYASRERKKRETF